MQVTKTSHETVFKSAPSVESSSSVEGVVAAVVVVPALVLDVVEAVVLCEVTVEISVVEVEVLAEEF